MVHLTVKVDHAVRIVATILTNTMSDTTEIKIGEIPKMVEYIAGLVQRTKTSDPKYIWANLINAFPQLKDKERCANCTANMVQDVYIFDCMDAWLLIEMGKAVDARFNAKMAFTVANQIRVQDLPVSYSAKSRTTQMSKLGLIAQLKAKNKADRLVKVPGIWVITDMGFKALRNEPVRRRVAVWRGEIQNRYEDETITITEAFQVNKDKVEDLQKRHKTIKSDYRQIFEQYNPQQWVQFGQTVQGALL